MLLIPSRRAQRVEVSAPTRVSGISFSGGTYSPVKSKQADKAGAWKGSCSGLSCSTFVLKSNGLCSPCFLPTSSRAWVTLSPQSLEGPWGASSAETAVVQKRGWGTCRSNLPACMESPCWRRSQHGETHMISLIWGFLRWKSRSGGSCFGRS